MKHQQKTKENRVQGTLPKIQFKHHDQEKVGSSRKHKTRCNQGGVIKGHADRARYLCDEVYLEAEFKNIQDLFIDDGYSKEEIISAMVYLNTLSRPSQCNGREKNR